MSKIEKSKNIKSSKVIELNLSATVISIIAIVIMTIMITTVKIVTTVIGSDKDNTLATNSEGVQLTYEDIGDHSSKWENYKDTTFEYMTTSGEIATKVTNSEVRIPTGSAEYTRVNNIYDMAGNVYDWTLEANGAYDRVLRGGRYSDLSNYYPAEVRSSVNPADSFNYGCRVILLIK